MTFNFVEKVFSIGNSDVPPPLQFYKRGFVLGGSGQTPSWRDVILSGNTALTLVNSKTNGLNYVKLFGATEQNGTPSPDTPVDIVSNNGVLKVSPNLFDFNTITSSTITIPVENGQTYTWSFDKTNYDFRWDSSAVWGVDSNGNTVADGVTLAPSSRDYNVTSYFCITVNSPNVVGVETIFRSNKMLATVDNIKASKMMFQTGTERTTYHPYGQIYTDGTQETVTVTGKNLFDYEYFYDNYKIYSSSAVGRCPIKLQPNTTYTVSTNKEVYSTSASMFVVSGNAIDWTPNTYNNGILVNSPRTVTTDSNGYLCFGLYVTAENAIPESDFINGTVWIQLEQGLTATDYEPYYYGGSANAEMLLSVGDYKDTQEVLGGNVTRNIGIKVLDGTENWQVGVATNCYSTNDVNGDILLSTNRLIYCNFFRGVNTVPSDVNNRQNQCFIAQRNKVPYLTFGVTTQFPDITDWANWLADQYNAGSPVVVVYPLATPTTETVTPQPLSIQAGTNIVSITQASIEDLELEVSYKAGVAVTITEVQNSQLSNQVTVTIGGNNG